MHKFLTAGLLALGVLAGSQQRAGAWINCQFGIGFNWCWQSGGNSCLWGLYTNGQVPGPWGPGYGGYAPYPPVAAAYPPAPYAYGYPYGGSLTPPTPPTPMQGPPADPFYFLQWD